MILNYIVSNNMMRQDLYKFQTRQQRIERQDSATRPQELSKVSSYTPGHWKSYIPHQISLSSQKRSQRGPSNHHYRNGEPNYDTNGEDDSRVRSILSSRKEEERRRQESAIRKVKELQDRVLPMVRGHRDEEEGAWIGWQSRIEQKLLRLQGHVQNMKREMELQLERRMVEMENKWTERMSQLQSRLQQR